MNVLTSIVLVFTSLTIALGLGAITTSLVPTTEAPGAPMQDRPVAVIASDGAWEKGRPGLRHDVAQSPVSRLDLTRAPAVTALPAVNSTGPWKSPLYPQNGVTLWDRIRVSSRKDRRAYLLGSAIQVHARATAASLRARMVQEAPLHDCPRSAVDSAPSESTCLQEHV